MKLSIQRWTEKLKRVRIPSFSIIVNAMLFLWNSITSYRRRAIAQNGKFIYLSVSFAFIFSVKLNETRSLKLYPSFNILTSMKSTFAQLFELWTYVQRIQMIMLKLENHIIRIPVIWNRNWLQLSWMKLNRCWLSINSLVCLQFIHDLKIYFDILKYSILMQRKC